MIGAALALAARRLAAASGSPRLDAELLLAAVLGVDRGRLGALGDRPLGAAEAGAFEALLARRERGESVAYLLGRREFWTLTLEVGPGVLVPRPETELIVEIALAALAGRPAPAVLDLGTGSGAIGLAIARERPDAAVDLVDASAAALAIAERNRAGLGLGNVRLLAGDWFGAVPGRRYDLIAANPPYLAADDPHLGSAELGHEPALALVAGPSGLEALAAIGAAAPAHLVPGGRLVLEHGATQGAAVRALLAGAGFVAVATRRDLAGHERATAGTRRD
ncbi:MAG TPA: peptide chain release factor N(5)-glutamine methyltransferase [Steroidobacteraceae bacterium]|nr:peptide chain release factor N(5)-glutamine methyltransferase [Steroidobacteraceae bacterium]